MLNDNILEIILFLKCYINGLSIFYNNLFDLRSIGGGYLFKLRGNLLIVLTLLFTLSTLFLLPKGIAAKETVSLRSGIIFHVKTTRTLMPKYFRTGDTVNLLVTEDVKVDDKIVIKAGTHVRAVVTKAQERGMMGKAGKLGIQLDTVKAVDGTTISLSGGRTTSGKDNSRDALYAGIGLCPLFALMKGEAAFIQANTRIQALVAGTYNIDVN